MKPRASLHFIDSRWIVINVFANMPLKNSASRSRGGGVGADGLDENGIQASDVSADVEAAIASTTTADQMHFASFAARVSWDPEQVQYCISTTQTSR